MGFEVWSIPGAYIRPEALLRTVGSERHAWLGTHLLTRGCSAQSPRSHQTADEPPGTLSLYHRLNKFH
ncbi:hypothetical protein GCM10025795_02480 [Verticiella sediminum]